jgi:sec-independent protein translocase protein TatC
VDERELSLTEHLGELRGRTFRILLAWAVGAVAAWHFSEPIFRFLLAPAVAKLGPEGGALQAIAPTEIFFTYLKCAVLGGLILALPVVFWQLWAFVSPGLYRREKAAAIPFVLVSTLLFLAGSGFAYVAVFPLLFDFFSGFDSQFVQSAWTMREVFALTTHLYLAFGVAFELPVFIVFLSLSGIVEARTFLRATPYAVLGVFVLAAFLTPPDWISQLFLAVPMVGLYLLGVGVTFLLGGGRRRKSTAEV